VTFSNLTAAGSPIQIGTLDSFEQGTLGARRDIVAGSVIAVPERNNRYRRVIRFANDKIVEVRAFLDWALMQKLIDENET